MDKRLSTLLLAGLLLISSGCASKKLLPTAPAATQSSLEAVPAGTAEDLSSRCRKGGAATIVGNAQDGSIFALYRPANWNGDLVIYAHGFIPAYLPVALPTNDYTEAIRDSLLNDGYAVAYSSYASNGFAVKDGISDTRALSGLFRDRLGNPRHTFLVAHSLGGLIAVALAERYPRSYDGAVTFSGVMGGSRRELAYVANVRILFDYFYPGVLPGDLLHLPVGTDLQHDVIDPAAAAMTAHPEGAFAISQIKQTPVPFASGPELVGSIVQALVLHTLELGDLLQRTGGESFFENDHTVYDGPLPAPLLQDLNARVARYEMPESAEQFLRRNYEPTGELEFPLLALHTTRDPTVPIFNETLFAERVHAAGRANFLTQRTDDRYGHVGFTPDQIMAAFREMVDLSEKRHRHHEDELVADRR